MSINPKIKILVIGALPPPIGGTTVLVKQLADELTADKRVEVRVINTARDSKTSNWMKNFNTALATIVNMILVIPKVDVVSFHASSKGTWLFGPIVHLISRTFRKPWILREFGGIFDEAFTRLNQFKKLIMRNTVLDADLCLFETKYVVDFFKRICRNQVEWYPNSRPVVSEVKNRAKSDKCRKFVFMSQVRREKGVFELIEVGKRFDKDITIDVYGPLFDGITPDHFRSAGVTRYCGVVDPSNVIGTLKNYDALLLPTHLPEGYPGTIFEAYSLGMPVITTKWRAQPEIVDQTCGLTIQKKKPEELYKAMKCLINDDLLFRSLREGALKKREQFASDVLTDKFVQFCYYLKKNH